MTKFSKEDLEKMGLTENPDGSFQKPPRKKVAVDITNLEFTSGMSPKEIVDQFKQTGHFLFNGQKQTNLKFRKVTLTLFGNPQSKQSVRATKSGHFYQPQKMVDCKKDYIKQILEQLPPDFKMFETEVHLRKFHCIFPPLKGFSKVKGKMEAIRNGEIFYKNTKPDLIDNLKKLVFDAMSGIVNKDDSIIVTENDTAKYFGIGGCVIIELEGY